MGWQCRRQRQDKLERDSYGAVAGDGWRWMRHAYALARSEDHGHWYTIPHRPLPGSVDAL
jgi:hypothetical protein